MSKNSFAALAATLFCASAALATSPHFVSATATVRADAGLTVSFKEAGLGASVTIDYLASASLAATWACITGGGKNPSAANKRTITSDVSKPGTFTSGKNGNVTASILLPAPALPAPEDFSCPPGQKLKLASVTYTSIKIEDTTNGVSSPIPDATKTLITLK